MSEVMRDAMVQVNDNSANTEHFVTVEGNIPDWLKSASSKTRDALRKKGPPPPAGLEQVPRPGPDAARQLHHTYAGHLRDEQQVNQVLAGLPAPDVFAEPLLKAAIRDEFGLELDVRTCYLFHARRAAMDVPLEGPSQDPAVLGQALLKAATQSLLASALQNFEAWETDSGAMDNGRIAKAGIFSAYPVLGVAIDGPEVDIPPDKFAALCRRLDLGGQYQALIQQTLNPAAPVAAVNLRAMFLRFEQSAFELQVQLAAMKNTISQTTQLALMALLKMPFLEEPRCSFLQLWDVRMSGIVVFRLGGEVDAQVESIVVYIPDDPYNPLREYESSVQFLRVLRESMLQSGYLAFFQRFVPARHRNRVFGKLDQAFHPKVWNPSGWYEQTLDRDARLHLTDEAFSGSLINRLFEQKVAVLRDDGLFHAVPTAEQDHKSRMDKLAYFFEEAFDALNIAAFVVPGLGEVMMGVMAVQLSYEVFEGIESLAQGEKDQAWGYFMDVVDNVALVAVLGAASAGGGRIPAVEVPEVVKPMRPVRLADGSTRLWKPDVQPYAHDIVLPAGLKPNALGLYEHQGKQWLALEGRTYAVKPQPYRLAHPVRSDAYEPRLRHNQAGVWLHEADQPMEWQGVQLLRRLGFSSDEFSDDEVVRILRVSGSSESMLRHALVEGGRPPALLVDTAQRTKLDREAAQAIGENAVDPADASRRRRDWFTERYQALQVRESVPVSAVQRAFPGLPTPVVEELLEHANPAELERLRAEQRVPQRIAEEARAYLQSTRLARAYEGLRLESVYNPDSDKLLLHTVEAMPGWSPLVRVEVRNASFHGPLIDSVGPVDAPIHKVLVKQGERYQARDAQDQHLHGSDDFYAALLHALPDLQRTELGFPHVGQGADLKRAVQAQPLLPRQVLRKVLNLQSVEPSGKSPMRLADGRLGYPLSGRGTLPGFFTEDSLLDKIRLLEFRSAYPEEVLGELYAAGLDRAAIDVRLNQLLDEERALRSSLAEWELASASILEQGSWPNEIRERLGEELWARWEADNMNRRHSSRQRIGEALWAHWEANSLPERGRSASLCLTNVALADVPEQLPDFVYQRVQELDLTHSALSSGTWPPDPQFLNRFLGRFPQLASVVIREGVSANFDLLLGALQPSPPRLRNLQLTNMRTFVTQRNLDTLGRLNLRRLDLSGNLLSSLSPSEAVRLNLDYFGLDRMDITAWPHWLDSNALNTISELSLMSNRITRIPDAIQENPLAGSRCRIALQGNPLPGEAIKALRLSEGPDRRFSFDLDVQPVLALELDLIMQERAVLSDALDNWAEASTSTAPVNAQQTSMRRRIRDSILEFWNNEPNAIIRKVLRLDSVELSEFPPVLPAFFYERVYRLELLRPAATTQQLNRFLRYFPQLDVVTLEGHITPMLELPEALLELPDLFSLSLRSQGLTIDQAAVDFFARIKKLENLDLDDNVIGTVLDGSALGRDRQALTLSLNNVGLQSWPAWLDTLLPDSMEMLCLENNQIRELPEFLLNNYRCETGHTDIVLRGNPLPDEVMRRAHVSESYNRPYSFNMDLPDEIRRLPPDRHDSDSEQEDTDQESYGHTHGAGEVEPVAISVEPWLAGEVDEEPLRRATWQQLEGVDNARDLLGMVAHLRNTADYRRAMSRPELIERVWRVLDAAARDTEMRLILNGMAEEPLRLVQNYDTCPDGIRLEFNQMEVQVYIRQSLRDASELERGQVLCRLTLRLYRLQALDDIARERAAGRDEAEVRLAYRLHWAELLDLPLPPSRMLYQSYAEIRPGELDSALAEVHQGERGQAFLDYAAQRDFWLEYLRETNVDRFRAIQDNFEARVLDLTDLYPEDSSDQYSARIKALEEQRVKDERQLIEELTSSEVRKYA
ncbi:NEL-type E3 ubiquitin ligase domain-containing protein [Pseudomonas huaxiensis]|uniref:NEL-type E3 ubiquitin ligase domain-containing protein n=1 Tax=Pseudomonas huaxiensis TaxID=2213017 RepID=UPI000DA6431B|nr:NEL-type E3 ubiquitin ligase domain-containing protein [Pseudomonas huaxiensis]